MFLKFFCCRSIFRDLGPVSFITDVSFELLLRELPFTAMLINELINKLINFFYFLFNPRNDSILADSLPRRRRKTGNNIAQSKSCIVSVWDGQTMIYSEWFMTTKTPIFYPLLNHLKTYSQ